MADILGKAILEISGDTRDIKETLEELKKKMSETADSAKGIGEGVDLAVFKEFGKIAVEAFTEVTKGIIELGERGAKVNDVTEAFGELSERAHSTGQEMLGGLRSGVQGTVSDFDLMRMSTAALSAGLLKNRGDAETLANGAMMLAKRVGGDTKESFETLTKAMETGRTKGLKTLGLFVDSKAATEAYAVSIGKSADELTDHEKAVATSNAVMTQLRAQFKDRAPLDFAMAVEQLVARFENFRDKVAVAISQSPVLMAGMRAIAPAFQQAFGGNSQDLIKTVVGLVEGFARMLVTMARVAIEGANQIVNVWTAMKVTFTGLLFLITGAIELNVKALQVMVDAGAKMPGALGAPFRAVQQSVRDISNELTGARKSFAAQTGEALDGAAAQKAALGSVDAALAKIGVAMDRAKGATVQATQAKHSYGEAVKEVATVSVKNAQAIAEAELKLQREISAAGRVGLDARLNAMKFEEQQEILGLKKLTGLSADQNKEMTEQVRQKYRLMAAAAAAGSDEIRDKTLQLEQQLKMATLSGTQARLQQIENERAKELQGIENLKLRYTTEYTQIAALIKQKYDQMSAAAQGHGLTVEQLAAAAGFKSRSELQQTADQALETYARMKESGEFNTNQLKEAFINAENAKRAAIGDTKKMQLDSGQAIQEGATQMLGALGEKNKTAAEAAAVVNTYLSVTKALASAPWPANLVLAAGALAVGMSNVAKIRSSKAYKTGTPGLDFADFGSMSPVELHNQEAVIPRGRGHVLAAEIAAALPHAGRDTESLAELREIRRLLEHQPRNMRRALRDVRR